MGIVAGQTFRMRLLVACFFAVVLSGAWVFAADAEKPEAKVDKDVTPVKAAASSDELAPPTAEEIARRDARAEDYKTLGEKFFKFPVTGSLYTRYRLQKGNRALGDNQGGLSDFRPNNDSASDQDFHSYLTMDFGDPNKHIAVGHFDIQADYDLDGYNGRVADGAEVDRRDWFVSPEDNFGGPAYYRLDSAYVDFNHLPGIAKLRVGRQMTYETPAVAEFDGVRLDTDTFFGDKELAFSFYGGRAAHHYEITDSNVRWNEIRQPNEEGRTIRGFNYGAHYTDSLILHDLVYGAAVEGRPWEGGKMRFDWQHLSDQNYDWYILSDLAQSDEFTLNVWHTFNDPNIKLNGRVTMLDGNLKETYARVIYYKEDWKLNVTGTYQGYYYHPEVSNRRAYDNTINYYEPNPLPNEIDPFSSVLGELQNYHQATLVLDKEWTDNFSTEAGISIRRIAEGPTGWWASFFPESSDTIFNRNYNRYFATLDLHDLPKNFNFNFSASYYDGKGEASDVLDLNAEASYNWTKQLQTTIGAGWGIYDFDLRYVLNGDFTNLGNNQYRIDRWRIYDQQDETQSYFIQQGYKPTRWATLKVGYEFEHARTNTFHTFTASFRFDF